MMESVNIKEAWKQRGECVHAESASVRMCVC